MEFEFFVVVLLVVTTVEGNTEHRNDKAGTVPKTLPNTGR
jgi:hypothetical protein